MNEPWDCIVVGGGAAGLSASLVLGRARRRTLLIDAGNQSNLPDEGVGGLVGHDGLPPAELYAAGRRELEAYPAVEVRSGNVLRGSAGEPFTIDLEDGSQAHSRKVILAMGMDYRVEDLPGMDGLWGRSVFHCPFCHGWEVRDGALAMRANGVKGVHGALMIRGWTDDVVLLTDGPADFDAEQRQKLDQAGVRIEERRLAGVRSEAGSLTAIRFTEGDDLEREALMVTTRLHQRSTLPSDLAVATGEPGPWAEDPIEVDAFMRTSVSGIFAAGDLAGQSPQVAIAVASGSTAGVGVVQSLLAEDFGLPLPAATQTD